MSKSINTDKIVELIYKSVTQTINSEENKELQDWLQKEDNRELYLNIIGKNAIEKKRKLYEKTNKEEVFKRIELKLVDNKLKGKNRLLTLMKYAAVFALFFVAGKWVYTNQFVSEDIVTKKAIEAIKPGYEKATLVLDDGTTVDLEAHQNEVISQNNLAKIENKEHLLQYESVENDVIQAEEIISFNTLHVPVGGIYQVVLPDGTSVWLNSKSSLKYPVKFSGDQRLVELTGEGYFEVTKSDKEFIVETNGAYVTVLGTKFNISTYDDDNFFTSTLLEGSVRVSSAMDSEKSVVLAPGQQGRIEQGKSTITISDADIEGSIAWIDGKFYFERENLEFILSRMSRWYNIDVQFDDPSIKTELFTGVAHKIRSIDLLLDMISESTHLNYHIKKNENNEKYLLTITRK